MNELTLYLDGQPIAVTTGAVLPESNIDHESVIEKTDYVAEYSFHPFPDPMKDINFAKSLIMHRIRSLPRKKKKRIKTLLRKGYTMKVTFV
jgi:hypothetical protein